MRRIFPSNRHWVPLLIIGFGVVWLVSGGSRESSRQLLQSYNGAGAIGFVGLGTFLMCLFVPKTFVSLIAGAVFGAVDGCWVLSLTAVTAALVNYYIGRWSLSPVVTYLPMQSVPDQMPASLVDRYADLRGQLAGVARDAGIGFHLLIRLAPIPTTVISYSMGAANARQLPYLLAALLATIPQWLWVYCGSLAMDPTESSAKWVGVGISAAAAISLAIVIPRQLTSSRKASSSRGEEAS